MQAVRLDQLLPKDVAARLLAFRLDFARVLPGVIEDVILFGSRARGDAQPDSDYDVAVLLSGDLADERDIRSRVYGVAYDYLLEGTMIQAVPLSAEEIHSTRTELAMRIAAEGIPVR